MEIIQKTLNNRFLHRLTELLAGIPATIEKPVKVFSKDTPASEISEYFARELGWRRL
jgi:hypothetical protein